jgi:hypothetical protein
MKHLTQARSMTARFDSNQDLRAVTDRACGS